MFYDNLKEICTKKKTSPCAVCVAVGISKSNVTAWKSGRSPNLDTVQKIAAHHNSMPMETMKAHGVWAANIGQGNDT